MSGAGVQIEALSYAVKINLVHNFEEDVVNEVMKERLVLQTL